jgi:hypothetical protein
MAAGCVIPELIKARRDLGLNRPGFVGGSGF